MKETPQLSLWKWMMNVCFFIPIVTEACKFMFGRIYVICGLHLLLIFLGTLKVVMIAHLKWTVIFYCTFLVLQHKIQMCFKSTISVSALDICSYLIKTGQNSIDAISMTNQWTIQQAFLSVPIITKRITASSKMAFVLQALLLSINWNLPLPLYNLPLPWILGFFSIV